MTLWGGRFEGKIDPLAMQLNASLAVDKRLWDADICGSVAWARALARAGVITAAEADKLCAGLQTVWAEFNDGSFAFAASDEDIHTAVERRLGEIVGEVAGKLHTGRSRNDQVATDFRLWTMEAIGVLVNRVGTLQSTLVAKAEAELETILPGYTHTQRAQPILFSHWLLSHFWALERDKERLAQTRGRADVMPLGSAALAGTGFPIDRAALAADLGFAIVAPNSLDAVADRDFAAEFLFDCALIGSHLSRLADALILYSTTEFGFVEMADAYSTGSSIMPQKKNPDMLELARGKAGTLIGLLTGLLSVLKGLPSAYDKDLQEDKAPVFAAFDMLDVLLPVVAGTVATMAVNRERMRAAVDSSLLATELADYLVRKGVPFRAAHGVVGKMVRMGIERGLEIGELKLDDLREISPAFDEDVRAAFNAATAVAARNVIGGTAPESVRDQLEAAKSLIETGSST
ncbi:MAG: argininosuccinate lyase [Chloroflexi bacterium]|nr:argininosuccinate lyase [Chloroflexota bacterium]